ncbi:hypothetical protein SMACR_04717 [Sordaria macrospora]|uniref:WGS project CABT00000000 data, contig 2.21 n=2 Tax=Sordaria macrospora TaxID=5147 RepID=F7W285_SORMK|nr:uncharacterized protein SMAC_04717 [Sordaria macrospora k-hell]KAA8628979.1 hypothetical protein SMACR_04717 [Sordaria macrospora]KAH7630896.1 hypothetical protein B0T09DRAFT_398484 [Sordaria sp. MPI-SDFR-AT-0083]WPJ61991.1 hypothetical protein SMAC4_04717 [Sordaria macrospora]CCC11735.1 unnamed protein product [Sordaria macrospora k-hell]
MGMGQGVKTARPRYIAAALELPRVDSPKIPQGTTSPAMRNKTTPQDMAAAAAANFKMQEHAAEVGPEKEKLGVKVEDTEDDLKCQLRMEGRRIDRLEKLVDIFILLEDITMPATEENRALFTKKIDEVESQYKATCAKQDAKEL